MDFMFGERYVVVNIPAAFAEAIANDKVERRYRVIVGKTDKPSPTLTAYITAVNLNPTWTVPLSITKNEIIGQDAQGPELSQPHAHARARRPRRRDRSASIDWSSDRSPNFTIRQDSGAFNALGASRSTCPIRIRSTCTTPTRRNLFADDYRFDSHGCTRVDNVRDLAAWVLEGHAGLESRRDRRRHRHGQTQDIRLPQKMPVAWVYLTGWVTRDGTINSATTSTTMTTSRLRQR